MSSKRMMLVVMLMAGAALTGVAAEPKKGREGTFQYVESRVFDAVKYDASKKTLTLLFDSGAAYAYHDVPRWVYLDFTRIVNKGEYFYYRIRKNYRGERLDAAPASWCYRD